MSQRRPTKKQELPTDLFYFMLFAVIALLLLIKTSSSVNIVLNLADHLPYATVQKNGQLMNSYNYSGLRGISNMLPAHWYIKESPDLAQSDLSWNIALQLLHVSPTGFLIDLQQSYDLTKESMDTGATAVYNTCSSPAALATNFSFSITYSYATNSGQPACTCNNIAGINTEILFPNGESDTTYSLPLGINGSSSNTRLVANTTIATDGAITVTAWPGDDGYDFTDRVISFCIVPVCSCGMLKIQSFTSELS